jgi:hypothetical protein
MVPQMARIATDLYAKRWIGERLAQFRAMLARDGEEFRIIVHGQRTHETDMRSIQPLPIVAGRGTASQFQGQAAAFARQPLRRRRQHGDGAIILRQYAATDRESRGHERGAEQAAAHMMQRQDAPDPARWPDRCQEECAIAGRLLDRVQPGGTMERQSVGMREHEGIDRARQRRIIQVHQDDGQVSAITQHHGASAACASASASTRVQAKSRVRRRSLAAMTDRLV